MKLGIGYLIFSGAELLKPAIQQVRKHAHYIVGLYSLKSNEGFDAPLYLEPLMKKLKKEGLFDEIIQTEPEFSFDPVRLQYLHRIRYNQGRIICGQNNCSHYMVCDSDEFYDTAQFGKFLLKKRNSSFYISNILEYVKNPLFVSKGVSKLYVPFIHKIQLEYNPKHYSVLMDLSRTVISDDYTILTKEEMIMHHMTAVRFNKKELRRKFQGHSHFMRIGQDGFNKYENAIYNADKNDAYLKLDEDKFGIIKYWKEEFQDFYKYYMGHGEMDLL